jgi:2-dehydropantoate 2-reductase
MNSTLPKICIVGAGAVGCFFGGLLAKAGYPVSLIARPTQIQKLNTEGIQIVWEGHTESFAVHASSNYELMHDATYVLIAVKTQATLKTAMEMKEFIKPSATVISLQNGLENAQFLKQHLQQNCFSALIYAAIAMTGPNQVSHFGGGNLILGNTIQNQDDSKLAFLAEMFKLANIPTKVSKHMAEDLWSKFIINCAYNGLSAIGMIGYADLVASSGIREIIDSIVEECLAIVQVSGINLDSGEIKSLIEDVPIHWPLQKSSTAQDLAQLKPTEIDYLNGAIVAKGKLFGIPTPSNNLIHSLIKMREITQGNFHPYSELP